MITNQLIPKKKQPHEKKHSVDGRALDEFFNVCSGFKKSDVFIGAMKFVGKFRQYAPLNAFLIFTQRPNATFVASRSKWRRDFGRTLTEGARPIVILAPRGPVTFVYDVADTEGRRLPEYFTDAFKVSGQFADGIWERTVDYCTYEDKFKIAFTEKTFLDAACVIRRGDAFFIEINRDFEDRRMRYASLVHELAHVYCGHLGGDPRNGKGAPRWKDRQHLLKHQREIEAETVAYLTAMRLGLETKSMEYVGSYMQDPEKDLKAISVKTILETASDIEFMSTYRPEIEHAVEIARVS
jgi:hypothetical protein